MPKVISVKQAARYLNKSPKALYAGYKRWGVPYFFIGGQLKFTRESLEQWVNDKLVRKP